MKKEISSFIIVGIINTIFGYGLYALFIAMGLNYFFAVLFATVLGVLFNFKTIGKYVFHSYSNRLIFKFFGVYAVVFITNIAIIKLLRSYGNDDYLSGAVATIPSAIISFILNKYYVFKR